MFALLLLSGLRIIHFHIDYALHRQFSHAPEYDIADGVLFDVVQGELSFIAQTFITDYAKRRRHTFAPGGS